ncbi:TIGR03767 family metallophosphoesterase [Rhodococcus aerolatus]
MDDATQRPDRSTPRLSRRGFLAAGGGAGALLLLGSTGTAAAQDRALARAAAAAVDTTGTTLAQVATPAGSSGYRRLTAGPGWVPVVRTELVGGGTASSARADARTGLATLVQLTDLHVTDTECPVRFEYAHPFAGSSAFRPHETLTAQGLIALVERVNGLAGGPWTGRAVDAVVSTGDNTDNHEGAELDRLLAVLVGGEVVPTTGDPTRYEGVQDSGSTLYWQPERAVADQYKQAGFPQLPGFLARAITPQTSPGLQVPWYTVFGNHDAEIVGLLSAGSPALDALYVGDRKIEGAPPDSVVRRVAEILRGEPQEVTELLGVLTSPAARVTPDERRRPFTPAEYVAAHLDPANTGAGPVGHGFSEAAAATGEVYYRWEIAPGVVGISMDTTNPAGLAEGSMVESQYRWIEAQLVAGSSRYHDETGALVTHAAEDTLFVLLSHHTADTMTNPLPDPRHPLQRKRLGDDVIALAHRFPNVVAWVNGHTHTNTVTPHPGDTPAQGFWEVNTASHVDYPQLARVVEVARNGDGTLSLLCTLLEADSPYAGSYTSAAVPDLAALYRELAFNDIHYEASRLGTAADRNVELLLPDPLAR